jgi:hypothetical protein
LHEPAFLGPLVDLNQLIENLSDQAEFWALMPGDWLHHRSSALLMPRLRQVVSVGKVKWIVDSPFFGKDNVCWMLFDRFDPRAMTRFIGRTAKAA